MAAHERTVESRVEREVGFVQFNNPRTLNGLTLGDAAELRRAVEGLAAQESIKVIVLSGAPEYFCTGGSMELLEQLAASGLEARREMLRSVQQLVLTLRTVPALVYAQFDGLAAGAGVDLLLACDHIIGSPSARINFSFGKMHLIPDLGGLYLLAQHVGASKALGIYSRSDTLDAETLRSLGVVDGDIVKGFAEHDWRRALRPVLAVSKEALAAAKASLWAVSGPQFAQHLEAVTESVIRLVDSEAHHNAVKRTRGLQRVVSAAGRAE